ncbi:MAG: hypothetical protein M1840_002176 [Geoglossum simile]|nr:MAG: hypothetical protein M1840_002176 [Geoglossum simile]
MVFVKLVKLNGFNFMQSQDRKSCVIFLFHHQDQQHQSNQMVENLATQVGILEKQNKSQMALLNGQKTQRSGKRMAVKGHFVLSTKEVLEKVREAEEETARKKETACKKATVCKKATGTSQRG